MFDLTHISTINKNANATLVNGLNLENPAEIEILPLGK